MIAFDQHRILNIIDYRYYMASRAPRNQELKMIIAEGYRDPVALSTVTNGLICTDLNCRNSYELNVRAMAYKVPGMLMTGYNSLVITPMNMVSEIQY